MEPIQLRVINFEGRVVSTVVNEKQANKRFRVVQNGTDDNGYCVDRGIYFIH